MVSTPLIYTINGSNRHEVLLISSPKSASSSSSLFSTLSSQISKSAATSPNCAEFMSKYKQVTEEGEKVNGIKVRWCTVGRDPKIWPASTQLTEENCEAVLSLMDTGKDVLEVSLG